MHRNAAGIDVGATEHWVAVPEERDEEPVRRFGAFTAALVAYLLAADNVSRPLPFRLRRVKQPVVRSQIRFSAFR